MNKEILIDNIKKSLENLYKEHQALFTMRVHERTICSQFACYLKDFFIGYNIDCEYNRNMGNTKECGNFKENYPDILIHKRLENNENLGDNNNLVYIEAKTTWTVNRRNKDDDIKKIKCFMANSPYNYNFGLFICFGKSSQFFEGIFYFKDDSGIISEYEFNINEE